MLVHGGQYEYLEVHKRSACVQKSSKFSLHKGRTVLPLLRQTSRPWGGTKGCGARLAARTEILRTQVLIQANTIAKL